MWVKQFPWCPLAIVHLYILNHLGDSQDILPTPQIYKLTADYISDKLKVEWYDGGSAFPSETDVTWEIQILRKEPMEEVALNTFESTLTGDDNLLQWEWTSDLPFNCTTHYVRIRSRLGEQWSEWSEMENIPDPPAVPNFFNCDVLNSDEIKCQWERGRSTGLYGSRGTHYFLTER
ncbi:hypothetical protein JD844_008456 [Phrynosoma platyrhinos]|uniref:Leukemia inhibitory factor receptor D2 domain-containing protein n=1 Tax=Phrynosoma platyrhinos TaxID=52577 RepID=A0ABQ7TDT1_PHRPL|nr:hypothetical protein JD844_008456 [Phrynosoma platyrhinos]